MATTHNHTSPIMTEDDACLHALQYAHSWLISKVIDTAIELDVFGIIARAGHGSQLSSLQIASHLLPDGKSPDGHNVATRLDKMLRLLATHALLTCSLRTAAGGSSPETRVYGLAPASKFFARNHGEEGSVASIMALFQHPTSAKIWSNMKDAIMEGGDRFEKIYGMPFYQYFGMDPTLNAAFNNAMAGISAITMKKVLEVYRGFDGLASLVDVGGGSGRILSMIIAKHPEISGINFDLPHVVQAAPPNDLGIKYIGGDMFVEIPTGDAILLKDVLHNWNDEHCLKLLKNCHKALPEDGKVIVITMIPEKVPDSSFSSRYLASIDYTMLSLHTGSERSEEQLKALFEASGFSTFQVACSAYGIWSVLEFGK